MIGVNMAHFSYAHLPPELAKVSERFHVLAHALINDLPPGEELGWALRKLLEAKDCAVRAKLDGMAQRTKYGGIGDEAA